MASSASRDACLRADPSARRLDTADSIQCWLSRRPDVRARFQAVPRGFTHHLQGFGATGITTDVALITNTAARVREPVIPFYSALHPTMEVRHAGCNACRCGRTG